MGKSIDSPTIANFSEPKTSVPVMTEQGPMIVDMTEILKHLGTQELRKGDVLSIRGYRDARGKIVPDYDSVQIVTQKEGG